MTNKARLATGTAILGAMMAVSPAQAQTTATQTTATQTTAPQTTAMPTTTTAKPLKPLYRNVRAYYRNVRAYWGDVNPFYRNVRAYWGDVDPFYRNVRAYWGSTDPTALASAAGAPAYAGVAPFWEGLGAQWEGIASTWQTAGAYGPENEAGYADVASRMKTLVATSEAFWGAAVAKRTGQTFAAGFADPLLARFGIDLNDPASLAALPANEQSEFFMNWYDGLMGFSGTDHVDHWMKTVNWSPRLTQIQGSGAQAIIGLVDQFSATDADTRAKLVYSGGYAFQPTEVEGAIHGAGVLSLINANHDGRGIMGIAPNARVAAYNPFDAQGGASWSDVIAGITQVGSEREVTIGGVKQKVRASVINLSLGAPGTTFAADWRTVFKTPSVDSNKDRVLYVIAAGNDGHRQTANVEMNGALDSTFIVVGSVDPNGKISDFSNTPGTACLTDGGQCKNGASLKEGGLLMNRFITAPGELLLVSDGKGGVTRQSGTSLAAPLVAGAVALIQDRWPWMKNKPRDVARMILGSARDVGAAGVDDVYGVGILDVEAAQSPLLFDGMKFYLYSAAGSKTGEVKAQTLESGGVQSTWTTQNMYLTAFEKVVDAERDFLIPLSATLYGSTRGGEYFQDFVYNRMTAWIAGPGFRGDLRRGFSDLTDTGAIERANGWSMRMTGRLHYGYTRQGDRRAILNSAVDFTAPDGRFGLQFGRGDGALAMGGTRNLGATSDFDPYTGGANPLLGFASGGSHMGARMSVTPQLELKAGATEQTRGLGVDLHRADAADRAVIAGMGRYKARAAHIGLAYRPASWLSVSGSATNLVEPNAFLGVRTTAAGAFGDGTATTGLTVGAEADLGGGVSVFGSATGTRSISADRGSAIRIRSAYATAFQAGVAAHGLLGRNDALRLSLAQPLSTARGSIELSQLQVIDRQTGEKGMVTERFELANPINRLVAEGFYGAPVMGDQGQVGLFARGELRDLDQGTPRLMLGGQFRLAL